MSDSPDAYHKPVLLAESIALLKPIPGNVMIDATVGGGGHAAALATALHPGGTLIGLDRDQEAIAAAQHRLASLNLDIGIILLRTTFGNMIQALAADSRTQGLAIHGLLFDLGVASHQLDTARGFSFRRDEPLDMRMAPDTGESAADLLGHVSERELENLLYVYGEERWARKIARSILQRRSEDGRITSTAQLANAVERAVPRAAWPRDIHVATRTFQALRIAVNDEITQLESGLSAAVECVAPGGRIAVISYHSLEDRIVKHSFAAAAGQSASAPGSSPAAFLTPTHKRTLNLLNRKPIVPTPGEIARNPRARSAKLRVAERVSG